MNYVLLTFRRGDDGSLTCSAPVTALQLNRTLDELVGEGYGIQTVLQGREDDDVDILLKH
ncbi:MAG TPA: hypothetical protein VNF68_01245 [Candidatus Baltobacteraceae bacterium]|nr:hypothetical protein [Candidatus Baltobacteraceae bacterium]